MMKNKCWNIGDRKFELSDFQAVVVVASHVVAVGLPAAFDDQNVVAASLVVVVSAVIDVQTFVVVVACGVADFVDGVLAVVVAAASPGAPVVIDLQAGVGSLVDISTAVVDDGVAVVVGLAVVYLAAVPVVQTLRYQLFDVDDSYPLILINLGSGCCDL